MIHNWICQEAICSWDWIYRMDPHGHNTHRFNCHDSTYQNHSQHLTFLTISLRKKWWERIFWNKRYPIKGCENPMLLHHIFVSKQFSQIIIRKKTRQMVRHSLPPMRFLHIPAVCWENLLSVITLELFNSANRTQKYQHVKIYLSNLLGNHHIS